MRRVWEKESVGREPDLGSGAGIAQEAGSWLMLKNRTGHLSFPLDFLVTERGGSVVVTIPAVLAAQLGIKGGSVVSFDTNGRELIVRLVNEDV